MRLAQRSPARILGISYFFSLLSAFSLSVSPWLVGGCEHDDKARVPARRTCVTLSRPLSPSLRTNPRPLTARMHCSARSPAYLHTTYITLFLGLEFVSRPVTTAAIWPPRIRLANDSSSIARRQLLERSTRFDCDCLIDTVPLTFSFLANNAGHMLIRIDAGFLFKRTTVSFHRRP